jgi:hypothetical protein
MTVSDVASNNYHQQATDHLPDPVGGERRRDRQAADLLHHPPWGQAPRRPARTCAWGRPTPVPTGWCIGLDRRVVSPEPDEADCSVRGRACELYLVAVEPPGAHGLEVRGDAAALDLWRHSVRVRWG